MVELLDYPTKFSYSWEAGTTEEGLVYTTRVMFTLGVRRTRSATEHPLLDVDPTHTEAGLA